MEWIVLVGILALASQRRVSAAPTEDESMRNTDIVPLESFNGHFLRRDAASAFAKAVAESDAPRITSSLRTRRQQEALYKLWLEGKGNLAAKPGTSKHEFGLALDARGSVAWEKAMERNGFRRTVKSEPWHWEFSS